MNNGGGGGLENADLFFIFLPKDSSSVDVVMMVDSKTLLQYK